MVARLDQRHSSQKPLRQTGFTLIELSTIVVIMAILSVAASSRFFSTRDYEEGLYFDDIVNSLRYARKLAVATGNSTQVSLTMTTMTLERRMKGSSCSVGTTFEPIFDPTTNALGFVRTAPVGLSQNFSIAWPIYFDGLGRAVRASDCVVIDSEVITLSGGKTIRVFGETGFIE